MRGVVSPLTTFLNKKGPSYMLLYDFFTYYIQRSCHRNNINNKQSDLGLLNGCTIFCSCIKPYCPLVSSWWTHRLFPATQVSCEHLNCIYCARRQYCYSSKHAHHFHGLMINITDSTIKNTHYSNIALLLFFFFNLGVLLKFHLGDKCSEAKSLKPCIRIRRGLQPPVTCDTRKHIPCRPGLPEGCGAGSSGGCDGGPQDWARIRRGRGPRLETLCFCGNTEEKVWRDPPCHPGGTTGTGPVMRVWTLDSVRTCPGGNVYKKEVTYDF